MTLPSGGRTRAVAPGSITRWMTGPSPNRRPPGLAWLGRSGAGRAWLDRLPRLVAECAARWRLTVGDPFPNAYLSLTSRASLPDGTPVVLKLQWPHRESEHEATALRLWDGDGAIRLLDHDPDRGALLLERCDPGRPLTEAGADVALAAVIDLLPRLWIPAGPPFRSLSDEAAGWAASLPASFARNTTPLDPRLLDAELDALRRLPTTQGEQVLVNQDLHGDNILSARREPWLVIDPKPLSGEREFGIAALVRGPELGKGREAVIGRLDRLSAALGLDRERARRWTLAQTVAWAFPDALEHAGGMVDAYPPLIEIATWLLDA